MALRLTVGAVALALTLGGCGQGRPAPDAVDREETVGLAGVGGERIGKIGDIGLFDRAGDRAGGGDLAVNRYLWQAALDTLAFLPIVSTDPFSGVIATDWGRSSTSPDERFKATVYVTDVRLEARSLKVAVFREVRSEDGWVAAPVDPATPRRIEDAILTRARMLKIEDLAEND